jgi:hypothetical protein
LSSLRSFKSLSKPPKPTIDEKSRIIPKKFKKGKTKIPKKALTVLKNWLTEHFQDPYPSHAEKLRLATEAGISFKQVQNWFTNARGRIWRRTFNPEKFVSQIEEKLLDKDKIPTHAEYPSVLRETLPIQQTQTGLIFPFQPFK